MPDRDLEIGGLLASVRSLQAQNGDQFRRIDALEVQVGKLEERETAQRARLDALGAPSEPKPSRWPDLSASWRFWLALLILAGIVLGWWTWDDVRGFIGLGVSP